MRVAAVIPTWNGLEFLTSLLVDLRRQSVGFDQILVIDNGSTDGSAEWAYEQPNVRVIRFPVNRGFAAAVNTGVQLAEADLVAVLNNDLRLPSEWLERMLAGIGSSSFAAGKVVNAADPRLIDGSFDALCRGGTAWRCGAGRPDGALWSAPRQVTFAPFTAVLLRRDDFLAAGGLDEVFESYLEDVEFGLRCASKGYTGQYVPDAIARHFGSATLGVWSARTVRQIARNQLILVARHYPTGLVREYGWQIAVAQLLWGFVALRHGRGAAWLRGKWDGLRAFRRVRRPGSDSTRMVLERSEQEIRRLQADTGQDWYWRLYFALTG